MNRFFVEPAAIDGNLAKIVGQDVRHIRNVLRLGEGDKIIICDGLGYDYLAQITKHDSQCVTAKLLEKAQNTAEMSFSTTLFIALSKGEKIELVIEKAVELGVCSIVPFISKYCVSRPDDKSIEKKTARWQAIAESAAKQCGRGIIPTVRPCMGFKEAMELGSTFDRRIFFYENATKNHLTSYIKEADNVALVTGPEGGFAPDEVALAQQNGFEISTLGPRIMRCETAPLMALSVLSYFDYN